MLRKSIAIQVGAYRHDYPWSEDLDLFLRIAEVGRLANLPDVLVKYRVHPGSTNWKKHAIQMNNKPRLIREAYKRRGLKVPEPLYFPDHFNQPVVERYLSWVWPALKDKNLKGARRHAWAAVKSAPYSSLAWRALYCAMRGH